MKQSNQSILDRLNYGEKSFVTKEERIFQKFNQQQTKWEKIIKKITQKSKKQFDDSVILQADNFRAKLETVKALDMIESDIHKYGERFWMMGLRLPSNRQKISNQPSQKVIGDIPEAFRNYSPGRSEEQLEIIRKPVTSKLKSKYEGKLPFRCFNSGKYFEDRLKKESPHNLVKIKHLDDRNYDQLEVCGASKLKGEISSLLDKSTNETKYQIVRPANDPEGEEQLDSRGAEEEQIINYDVQTIRRKGGLHIKTYHLQQQC